MQATYNGSELEKFALARNWKRYVSALLGPYIGGRVLEIGAGIGETTRALWNDRVTAWTCLEPDPRLAARITDGRSWQDVDNPPEVLVGTVEDLDSSRRFDTILYIDVLEHIKDDSRELVRASSLLSPGGKIGVLSPAFQFLYSRFDGEIGHYRRYTARSLAAAFPQTLEQEALLYADSLGVVLSLANRLLLRRTLPTARQIAFWDRVVVPVSRFLDPILGRRLGRSVIAVYRGPGLS